MKICLVTDGQLERSIHSKASHSLELVSMLSYGSLVLTIENLQEKQQSGIVLKANTVIRASLLAIQPTHSRKNSLNVCYFLVTTTEHPRLEK